MDEDNKVEDTEAVLEDQTTVVEDTEEEIEEGTAACDTLKPGGGSAGGTTKAEMLDTMVSLMSQLGKEDLSKFHNDSLAQIGKEADKVPGGAAAKNKNSVAAKPSAARAAVKEDLDEIFENEEEFSEEFKAKALTLFEAAISTRATLEETRLQEEYEAKEAALHEQFEKDLDEAANEIAEDLTEKLDSYLNYNVDTFMEENEVGIDSMIRTDLAESFMAGLYNLFTEHNVDVPDSAVDLVAEMKEEIDALKNQLNETINTNLELEAIVESNFRENMVDEAAEGLTESQKEKLFNLSEGIEFETTEEFENKLNIIKESYFGKKDKTPETGLITEEIDGDAVEDLTEEAATSAEPNSAMEKYLRVVSRK